MSGALGAKITALFNSSARPSRIVSAETATVQPGRQEARTTDNSGADGRTTTFFLSHGSPMLPIQMDEPARQFMVDLPRAIQRPKAIVIVSAHWETSEPTVNCMTVNTTIHDFYGFPKELYKLQYNAPGSPELSQKVLDLLKAGGFPNARMDEKRGLDHGAWVPLLLMYPNKDIPVVQVSLQSRKDGAHHYRLGQALAPLKNEGVLVIGSGSATHNLRTLDFEATSVEPWALAFDNWLNDAIINKKHDDVIHFTEKAPNARKAHPSPEHFLPAIVALGAAGQEAEAERVHNSWCVGTLSMSSFAFRSPAAVATSA